MSRFLYYTDPHLSVRCPVYRIDDYSTSLIAKLEEVYDIAEKNNADFVLCGGDFFNSHSIFSFGLINNIIDVLNNSNLDTYSIIGQHDIFGYNSETFKSSTLAFIERHCKSFYIIREPVDKDDLVIYPCHCYDDFNDSLDVSSPKKKYSILVAHKLISKKKAPFDVIVTSEIKKNGFNLILSGDLHSGVPEHAVGKTTYYNPGSLVRRAINEIGRKIKVGLIDVSFKKGIAIKEICLKNVGKAEDVFSMSALENKSKENINTDAFISGIEDLENESVDIFDFIEKAAQKEKLNKNIIEYIMSKKDSVEV